MVSQLHIQGLSSGLAAVCEGLLLAPGISAGEELRGSPPPFAPHWKGTSGKGKGKGRMKEKGNMGFLTQCDTSHLW